MSFSLLRGALAAVALLAAGAADASVIFSNGAPDGTQGGAIMNQGYAAQILIPVAANANATSIDLAVWVASGATPTSVDWAFSQSQGAGNLPDEGTASLTNVSFLDTFNGFDVYTGTISTPQALAAGTWYLTLQNAVASDAGDMFLDINTTGSQSTYVYCCGSLYQTDGPGSVTVNGSIAAPEPAVWALMILGVGFVGAGLRLRKLVRPA
ncbi:MAG TPA: PEPxxWA-CTERM sorting domain-containing protein [Caulobacteraceae bacterium]|nr:PEPxxWA-CTERM sorting domain-containing protein [Caulobacteraceae bacterium]